MSDPGPTLAAAHDGLLFDLDGTLFRGDEPIPGAPDAVRKAGVPSVFVTNNASRAPGDVAEHLTRLGFEARAEHVVTSAQASLALLAEHRESGTKVLVVGADGFRDLAAEAGFTVVHSADEAPEVVLQGLSKTLTWAELAEGCLAIRAGALWIAANLDPTIPTERGFLPGNGSLVAAMRTATEAEPLVAGKPEPGGFRTAADRIGARRALVCGDRLDTDIEGAVAAGMDSLAVLSGHVTVGGLLAARPHERPTHLGHTVAVLLEPEAATRIVSREDVGHTTDGAVIHVTSAPGHLDDLALARAVLGAAWDTGATRVAATGDMAARLAAAGLPVG